MVAGAIVVGAIVVGAVVVVGAIVVVGAPQTLLVQAPDSHQALVMQVAPSGS